MGHTVRWYEQYELTVSDDNASTEEEAIEYAKDHLNEGENIDTFDFTAQEE